MSIKCVEQSVSVWTVQANRMVLLCTCVPFIGCPHTYRLSVEKHRVVISRVRYDTNRQRFSCKHWLRLFGINFVDDCPLFWFTTMSAVCKQRSVFALLSIYCWFIPVNKQNKEKYVCGMSSGVPQNVGKVGKCTSRKSAGVRAPSFAFFLHSGSGAMIISTLNTLPKRL